MFVIGFFLPETQNNKIHEKQFYLSKADDTENLNKILSEYQGDYQNMWAHLEQKYIMGIVQKVKRKAVLDTNPTTRADAILEGK